jgi:hypothetical protein
MKGGRGCVSWGGRSLYRRLVGPEIFRNWQASRGDIEERELQSQD